MTRSSQCIAVAALALLASCASHKAELRILPAYSAVAGEQPSVTRCLYAGEFEAAKLPAMIPFASAGYACRGTGRPSRDVAIRSIWKLGLREGADVVIVELAGTVYAGSVGIAWTSWLSTSSPTYAATYAATLYRVAHARIGYQTDDSGMVVSLTDRARESGMQEGDKLISLNGAAVIVGGDWAKSPHWAGLARIRPGDDVKVVWIRPGTGRMEGVITASENPPTHLEMADAIPLKKPKKKRWGSNR